MDGRIKYRHIAAFVEITRRQSLKRAADALHLTQPAISKTLRDLEEILGATLLTRGRGGVALTPEGDVFLQFAQVSLSALQQGIAGVGRVRGGGGRLAVGALPSVAARVLPLASDRFAAAAPDTVLVVEDGPHGYLMERLRAGILDLVVGRLGDPESMGGVSFTPLYSEHVVFVTRPGHPLTDAMPVARLADWPVIYPPEGAAIRPLVDRLMVALGLGDPGARVETVSGAFGREMALRGDAVWIISQGVVQTDLQKGRLVRLDIDTGITAGPVGIMTRAEEDMPPPVRLFRRAVVDAVEMLGL